MPSARPQPWAPWRLARLAILVAAVSGCGGSAGQGSGPAPLARRVVSLDPALTEVVTALGARALLVGRTRHCQVSDAETVPVVGDLRPVPEKVLAVAPDLVLMADYPSQAAARSGLVALGAPVLPLPLVSLGDLRAAIASVGARLGRIREAEDLAGALDSGLAALSRCRLQTARTFVIIHGLEGGHAYTTGGGDHVAALLEQAGLRNALEGHPKTARIGLEVVVAARPDLILHTAPSPAHPDTASAQAFWAAFPELPAVERRAVRVWPDDRLARNGPQLAGVAGALCAFLAGAP